MFKIVNLLECVFSNRFQLFIACSLILKYLDLSCYLMLPISHNSIELFYSLNPQFSAEAQQASYFLIAPITS